MVEIQFDEYGGGRDRAHARSACSPTRCEALGLDARYGAYLDLLPATTLATVNLISMLRPAPALARRRSSATSPPSR